MYNKIIENDIEEIASSQYIDIEDLKNRTILVTGATGMIGSMTIMALLRINKKFQSNIKIIALARNEQKLYSCFDGIELNNNFIPLIQDIIDPIKNLDMPIDYIIHTATTTTSLEYINQPVDTINTIITGTKNILDFARQSKTLSIVYLSTMEVYGVLEDNRDKSIKENEYGYIDILNERSSYSQGKRMAECLCYAYYKQYNTPINIARLSQTLGSNISISDNKVFVQFARNLINREDIVLYTDGMTIKNYAYITDTITAIFKILHNRKFGESYNIANQKAIASIKDMAESIAKYAPETNVVFQIDGVKRGHAPKLWAILDTKKLENLGWQAKIDLDEMYRRLIESMSIQYNMVGKA